jgi:Nif-specific regulatory protein
MSQNQKQDEASIDRLKEISSWVSSVHDLNRLLDLIIETATRVMDAKAGSLLLLDRKTEKLHFKVVTGAKSNSIREHTVGKGQGIAGTVVETGRPLLVPDVKNDERWYRDISEAIDFETRSIACVPLKHNGDILGVMQVVDKKDGTPLQEKDMVLLSAYADLAAMAIGNAKKIAEVRRENQDLREALETKYQIIGTSAKHRKVVTDAMKVAGSNASVLISGESGTGKELLCRLIHRESSRKNKPLVALNCAAVPETLLEDELFGHEKGAFTGAAGRKIGKFELADGGTIFLDEIGEMISGMQAKLLRVLQEGVFYRIGGNTPISVDVRVISATNRDIEEEVKAGRFREDLYYRLNVVHISIPPLRERKEDLPPLVTHFMELFRSERGGSPLDASPKAMEKIMGYDWPGNVRELRNALERAVVMGGGSRVEPEDLLISASKSQYPGVQVGMTLEEALNEFKKEFIVMNLEHTGGNRSKAAEIMDIQRTYLSRLISKYQLRDK